MRNQMGDEMSPHIKALQREMQMPQASQFELDVQEPVTVTGYMAEFQLGPYTMSMMILSDGRLLQGSSRNQKIKVMARNIPMPDPLTDRLKWQVATPVVIWNWLRFTETHTAMLERRAHEQALVIAVEFAEDCVRYNIESLDSTARLGYEIDLMTRFAVAGIDTDLAWPMNKQIEVARAAYAQFRGD